MNFENRTIIKGVIGIFVKQTWLNFNKTIIEGGSGNLWSKVGQNVNPHDKNLQTLIAADWFVLEKRKHL